MNTYSRDREVEKVPLTRTERHLALKAACITRLQRLSSFAVGISLFLGPDCPLRRELDETCALIVDLSAELKVPK